MRALKIIAFLIPLFFSVGVASAHFTSGDIDPYFYTVVHTAPYDPPVAGQLTQVFVNIFNTSSGEPVSDLDVVHDRRLHMFIISEDFEEFVHTHPDDYELGLNESDRGSYFVFYSFPKVGKYLIVADYTVGGRNAVKSFPITAYSEGGTYSSEMAKPVFDYSKSGNFDGYDIYLESPAEVESGKEVNLDYRIERGGDGVTDLQNLLGSAMHVVVVKSDMTNVSHTHAYVPSHTLHVGSMPQRYSGPVVPVRYTFPSGGDYVVFSQFMHDDRVVTTRFFVSVKEDILQAVTVNVLGYVSVAVILVFVIFVFRDELNGLLKRVRQKKSKRK